MITSISRSEAFQGPIIYYLDPVSNQLTIDVENTLAQGTLGYSESASPTVSGAVNGTVSKIIVTDRRLAVPVQNTNIVRLTSDGGHWESNHIDTEFRDNSWVNWQVELLDIYSVGWNGTYGVEAPPGPVYFVGEYWGFDCCWRGADLGYQTQIVLIDEQYFNGTTTVHNVTSTWDRWNGGGVYPGCRLWGTATPMAKAQLEDSTYTILCGPILTYDFDRR